MREIANGIESTLMPHTPTVEELEAAIAETEKRLASLKSQLAAIRHQNK